MSHSLTNKLAKLVDSDLYKERSERYKRMIILGEKIYGRRKDLELTQGELAEKTGLGSQRAISQLESGEYAEKNGITDKMYSRLAEALNIDSDYLFSEKIDRRTFELFAYLSEKLDGEWDKMQFMKLPYFIDLASMKQNGHKLSNFNYKRYTYGPFDSNVYKYRSLFEGKKYNIKYSFLEDFSELIEETLKELPIKNSRKLKELSYQTAPMKKIKATLGGQEAFNELLDLAV